MPKSKRVLVIGLDGATWDVLDPWIQDGSLPNLARLRQNGSAGFLRSTLPPLTAAAWSTFMTGKRPGKHGVFHFIDLFSEEASVSGKPTLVNGRNIKSSVLWDIIAHNQGKVTVINVPMTYPPRPVNGSLISCFLTPKNAPTFTYPPELATQLTDYIIDLDRFIDAKPYQDSYKSGATTPSLDLMQEFRDMTEKRARVTLSLMDSQPWDFFMVVFISTDRMGHYLWPYHRSPNPNDTLEVQDLCRAVYNHYKRLDEIIGELIAKAGDDVNIVIMSDHGMGPRYSKRVHCNFWLKQKGWLETQAGQSRSLTSAEGWLRRLGIPRDKVGRLLFRIPGVAKSRVVKKAVKSQTPAVDRAQSKAYSVPIYDNIAGIRVTLTGESKEQLCQEITQELYKIVDPETKQKIVNRICRGNEYYEGPYAENIPDLIVILKPEYGFGYQISNYSSVVTKVIANSRQQGDHRLDGIFIAAGPDISPHAEMMPNLAIEDIAPTILYLMELPVPSDMDGRTLTEIIKPEVMARRPVTQSKPVGFWPNENEVLFNDEVMSDEDEAEIRGRLQALGYLE